MNHPLETPPPESKIGVKRVTAEITIELDCDPPIVLVQPLDDDFVAAVPGKANCVEQLLALGEDAVKRFETAFVRAILVSRALSFEIELRSDGFEDRPLLGTIRLGAKPPKVKSVRTTFAIVRTTRERVEPEKTR